MNVLLVGLGRWGELHLRVLGQLGASVWVADVSPRRLALAVERGVAPAQAVADYRVALAHVDAVDVVTPADSHLAVAGDCLRAGRHCFVEKPLALTVAESRELERIAEAAGRVLQVGHIFRFHPVTIALREALERDEIGRVRYATGRFAGFKRPRTDVGVNQSDGIHYFDLFAYLFRARATSVTALQRDFLGRGLDDMSVTTVTYGDIPVVVEANYFVPGKQRDCVIVGERGSLVADYDAGTVRFHAGDHRKTSEAWEAVEGPVTEIETRRDEPLRRELAEFLASCRGQTPVAVPASDGVHAMEIVEAAARSARTGRTVSLG
jgi:UDP-N-acetylglucosamine 3-dehydrogenase